MEGRGFDRLAKQVARGMTRRRALQAVVGGAVAGTLGAWVRGDAVAGKACTSSCDCPFTQACYQDRCYNPCGAGFRYCRPDNLCVDVQGFRERCPDAKARCDV
jgi:hypothetical protein